MKQNKKHFYSHIIEIESLSIKIESLNLSEEKKDHLIKLVEHNVHYEIIDSILSELKTEDKKTFLTHLAQDSHDKIWDLLKNKVDNVENKIKEKAKSLIEELEKDIT